MGELRHLKLLEKENCKRRDFGGRYELELQRTPVDLVEKRVRLIGTLVGKDLVNADGVAPA